MQKTILLYNDVISFTELSCKTQEKLCRFGGMFPIKSLNKYVFVTRK